MSSMSEGSTGWIFLSKIWRAAALQPGVSSGNLNPAENLYLQMYLPAECPFWWDERFFFFWERERASKREREGESERERESKREWERARERWRES